MSLSDAGAYHIIYITECRIRSRRFLSNQFTHYDFQSFQPQQNLQNKWVSKSYLCTIFIASLTLANILRKKNNCRNGEKIISLETKLLVHSIANLKFMAVSQFHGQIPFLIYGKGV